MKMNINVQPTPQLSDWCCSNGSMINPNVITDESGVAITDESGNAITKD